VGVQQWRQRVSNIGGRPPLPFPSPPYPLPFPPHLSP